MDLPIQDVKNMINELIDGDLGVPCLIDGTATRIMMSDLVVTRNFLEQNMKQLAIKRSDIARYGSKIEISDETNAVYLIFTRPSDDLVSWSCRALLCNSSITIKGFETVYKDDGSGDILSRNEVVKDTVYGFIDRFGGGIKKFSIGSVLKSQIEFYTFTGANVKINDFVYIKSKKYQVIDKNDVIDGLLVLTLESDG